MQVPPFSSLFSRLLSLLRPSVPRFKASVPVLLFLLWCSALIWIWWWGPTWQYQGDKPLAGSVSRWLLSALLVLLLLGIMMWRMAGKLQRLQLVQRQISAEEEDPVNVYIHYQSSYLSHWLAKLRQHLGTPRYLYRLPWYLVIGGRQSGKSTLLRESCKFTTLTAEALHSEQYSDNDTRLHTRCWVGEQAVVFEPDGALVEQNEVEAGPRSGLTDRLWQSLLDWLVAHRRRQPINGIIVTLDLPRLITLGKDERERYSATLQQRLQDIAQETHSYLPVYVVFTKLDLLYGFEAMYQLLSQAQRQQILGVTFSMNSTHPQFWHTELAEFWQQWLGQLNAALMEMMQKRVDSDQRRELFSFTRQVSGVHPAIERFIEAILFNGDRQRHLLRGIYLTSARQSGQMDDLFVQSAATQYHLTTQAYPTWPAGKTSPYFSHDLFQKVIFCEPNLATENSAWLRSGRNRLIAFSCAAGAGALALIGGWHYYYGVNYDAGVKVLAQTKTFLNIPMPKGEDQYGDLQLPLLNPIREATLAYGSYHENNALLNGLGLYQGNRVGPYIESTYLKLLLQRYLPALMSGLLAQLNAAAPNSEQKLEILRIMRMLEDKSGRRDEMVEGYMRNRWSQHFTGQRNIQEQLMQHLDYALQHTDWRNSRSKNDKQAIALFSPYSKPIQAAQRELGKLPLSQRVYQNVRSKSFSVLPPDLDLRDEIGSSFDAVFTATDPKLLQIPQFLTRAGLTGYFVLQYDQLVEITALDSWVLNLTKNVQYSETDRQDIQRKLNEQYLGDYGATWRAALGNLDVMRFADIPATITALEQVISGEQPFRRALQTLRDNTRLPVLSPDLKGKELEEMMKRPAYRLLSSVNRTFAPQTTLLTEEGEQNSILQGVYQQLTGLHRYLMAIQNSPAPGKSALKAVQLRLTQNSSDPVFEVQQMAKNLPEPLNRWVGGLAEQAWRVVMVEAIHSLELEWNSKVVKKYQSALAGRYPFDPASKQDVSLKEFQDFFKPGGILDSFYEQNLKVFIENNATYDGDGEQLIREDVIAQLEQAQRIRDTFFNSQGDLDTQFIMEPVELSANKRRSVLNLDGQLLDYSHGRTARVNLVWPNTMRSTVESKITLVPNGADRSPRSVQFTGPWAQLRLINSGKLTDVRPDSFDVRFDVEEGHMIYRVYIDEAKNPFGGGLMNGFALPETLY